MLHLDLEVGLAASIDSTALMRLDQALVLLQHQPPDQVFALRKCRVLPTQRRTLPPHAGRSKGLPGMLPSSVMLGWKELYKQLHADRLGDDRTCSEPGRRAATTPGSCPAATAARRAAGGPSSARR